VGEFGALDNGPPESRELWTHYVRSAAEHFGFASAYWEFDQGFGAYDSTAGAWRTGLLEALLGTPLQVDHVISGPTVLWSSDDGTSHGSFQSYAGYWYSVTDSVMPAPNGPGASTTDPSSDFAGAIDGSGLNVTYTLDNADPYDGAWAKVAFNLAPAGQTADLRPFDEVAICYDASYDDALMDVTLELTPLDLSDGKQPFAAKLRPGRRCDTFVLADMRQYLSSTYTGPMTKTDIQSIGVAAVGRKLSSWTSATNSANVTVECLSLDGGCTQAGY
jgi:hypothetical protein